jgi:hypothetical protein
VSVADSFFAGYELFYDSPADTFSTYMADTRSAESLNSAYVYNNDQWISLEELTNGQIRSSFAVMPVVFDSVSPSYPEPFTGDIRLYPNPASIFRDSLFWSRILAPINDRSGLKHQVWEQGLTWLGQLREI